MTQEIYAKQDNKIFNEIDESRNDDHSTGLLSSEGTLPRKMPVISDEPVFSSDDRSSVVKVKHRKPSSASNYQSEAFLEPSKEEVIIKRPVNNQDTGSINEMMDRVKNRFTENNNNNDNHALERDRKFNNHPTTISNEDILKKERLERIRARWEKLGPIIKNRVNRLFSKARLSQTRNIGKEVRRFSTTTPKTFELDKKQSVENNFDMLTQLNRVERPILHSVRTMTDDKLLGHSDIQNFNPINKPPIARPTFNSEFLHLDKENDDLHNRVMDNDNEPRKNHYRFVNKVASRPRLRIRRPGSPPTAKHMTNEVVRAAGSSVTNRQPLSLPELSPITSEEESVERNVNNNRKILSRPLPSIPNEPSDIILPRPIVKDDKSNSFKSTESEESVIDSSEIIFGDGVSSKSEEKFNEGEESGLNFKAKVPSNIQIEPPFEPSSNEIVKPPKKSPKKKPVINEEPEFVPQNSGLRPVAPPTEFGSTGGFGSGFGGGSGGFGGGSAGFGGGSMGGGFGSGSGMPFSPSEKSPVKTNDKTYGIKSSKQEIEKDDEEEEESVHEEIEDSAFSKSKGPSPGAFGHEHGPGKESEFNQEELFTGDSALNVNKRGPTGDGYGPPIVDGAAIPPPVHGISYGGDAAGVGSPMGMIESYTRNPPTTVKPSALLNILNKADQGINQAITHFERGSPVETAAIDILEVALGSQRLDSQAKLLGHVDRTFGLDNLQRLQRWANTGGALDMLKEQFAKIAKNYKPPADLLPTIPPQLEYLFSPSNNGKK
uniref:PH domain-containing protein n=1 Tax=Parastrongyloides trichosuri TaxID=131310 RepID=A0A0N5A2W5_PARTI